MFTEPVETERLHRYSGSHREHGQRFLAHDMAGKRLLHRHVDQDFRFYQGTRRIILFNCLSFFFRNGWGCLRYFWTFAKTN